MIETGIRMKNREFTNRLCVVSISDSSATTLDGKIWWPALKFNSLQDFISKVSIMDSSSADPGSKILLEEKAALQWRKMKDAANLEMEDNPRLAYLIGRTKPAPHAEHMDFPFVVLPKSDKEILGDFYIHYREMMFSGSDDLLSAINTVADYVKRLVVEKGVVFKVGCPEDWKSETPSRKQEIVKNSPMKSMLDQLMATFNCPMMLVETIAIEYSPKSPDKSTDECSDSKNCTVIEDRNVKDSNDSDKGENGRDKQLEKISLAVCL